MLPIRQTINALPSLGRTNKAVLTEVCQLAEPSGWCTARNKYLADALASSERTITRRLTALEGRGLLVGRGQGKARQYAPTPALRACYLATDEQGVAAAVAALNLANLDTSDYSSHTKSSPNIDTLGAETTQSGEVGEVETAPNLDTLGQQPRHFGSANLDTLGQQPRHFGSRVIGDQQDPKSYQQNPLSEGERFELQKKIGDLQQQVADLKAQLVRVRKSPPVAAGPPRIGHRNFSADWPEQLRPPFAEPEFREAWARWAAYRYEIGKAFAGDVSEQADLDKMGELATGSLPKALKIITDTISANWKKLTYDDSSTNRTTFAGQRNGTGRPGAPARIETLPTYGRNRGGGSPAPQSTAVPA